MIFELRKYTAMPGKMPDLLKRFENHTLRLFKKHDMNIAGFWCAEIDDNSADEIFYLLTFKDRNHLETSWNQFFTDEEWIKVKKESEQNGPLVAGVKSTILRTPAFFREGHEERRRE
ncbi:NIPSNAP family protein [Aneurinibacillus sp. UBA3580]|jgi:hypothetical protein|uniref:NIPSNAP family protein n=1 Tax=Aneurinibacillus sp. UBA3580 TaxID=1946041 RepID=UPI0025799880|nr:NIPSNAP family protein [Aneurinibacillus sp. UBA3580]